MLKQKHHKAEEDILERLQEDYRLSDVKAEAYLKEAEEIFLRQFRNRGVNMKRKLREAIGDIRHDDVLGLDWETVDEFYPTNEDPLDDPEVARVSKELKDQESKFALMIYDIYEIASEIGERANDRGRDWADAMDTAFWSRIDRKNLRQRIAKAYQISLEQSLAAIGVAYEYYLNHG